MMLPLSQLASILLMSKQGLLSVAFVNKKLSDKTILNYEDVDIYEDDGDGNLY